MRYWFGIVLVHLFFLQSVQAEMIEQRVEYSSNGTKLIGYIYGDTTFSGARPGVLIFSDWMGIGAFSKEKAKELVKLGYVAFVADIYGEEKAAKDSKEAGELAGKLKNNRPLIRARANSALSTLLSQNRPGVQVDSKKVAAIGFCFGGMVGLELSRSGAEVAGVVSFHGTLTTPDPLLASKIRGRLLVLHGADDPFVPPAEVEGFEKEMNAAGVDWQLIKYSQTVHAFTNPGAGNDKSKGAAYNKLAAERSFRAMAEFFREILGA